MQCVIEVRDRNLVRVGQLPLGDVQLTAEVPVNAVGTWELELDANHPMVGYLLSPGSGLIVSDPVTREVLWSGPTDKPKESATSDSPGVTVKVSGVTDDCVLADALAWPEPGNTDAESQAVSRDEREGPAESLMHEFVAANIGPLGGDGRRIERLAMGMDGGRGEVVSKGAQLESLLTLCADLAAADGLTFRVVQRGSQLVFETGQAADQRGLVRLSFGDHSLESATVALAAPEVTRVIVAGNGGSLDRLFMEVSSESSLAAEDAWGRRREVFVDSRSTRNLDELIQAGNEALGAAKFPNVVAQVIPTEATAAAFGVTWRLGDYVTAVAMGQEFSAPVTALAMRVDAEGARLGFTLGDAVVADPLVRQVRSLAADDPREAVATRAAVYVSDVAPAPVPPVFLYQDDLWIDEGNGNVLMAWDASLPAWVPVQDAGIGEAKAGAASAAAAAAEALSEAEAAVLSAGEAGSAANLAQGEAAAAVSAAAAAIVAAGDAQSTADEAVFTAGSAQSAATGAGTVASAAHTAANSAASAASAAANAAAFAQATADGKSTVVRSEQPASGAGFAQGDLWFQYAGANVIAMWLWDSGAWVAQTLRNEVIASVDAGKVTTGLLDADRIGANSITTEKLDADAITAKHTITGAKVQTSVEPDRGVKMTSGGLVAFDNAGAPTFAIDANGSLALTGAIQAGSSVTGATVQTTATANRGVKITSGGVVAYDGSGVPTFSVNASTGAVSMKGDLTSGSTITGAEIVGATITGGEVWTEEDDYGSVARLTRGWLQFYKDGGAHPVTDNVGHIARAGDNLTIAGGSDSGTAQGSLTLSSGVSSLDPWGTVSVGGYLDIQGFPGTGLYGRALRGIGFDTDWQTLPLATGWTGPVHYRIIGGVVHLRGQPTRTSGSSATIGTLPAAARPAQALGLTVRNGNGTAVCNLAIGTTGAINTGSLNAANPVYLDTISFPLG